MRGKENTGKALSAAQHSTLQHVVGGSQLAKITGVACIFWDRDNPSRKRRAARVCRKRMIRYRGTAGTEGGGDFSGTLIVGAHSEARRHRRRKAEGRRVAEWRRRGLGTKKRKTARMLETKSGFERREQKTVRIELRRRER